MCTKECGQTEPPDERDLVEAFRIVTNDTFAFLYPAHAFAAGRLETYNLVNEERVVTPPEAARFPFVAEFTFPSAEAEVLVSYGGREYELSVSVGTAAAGTHPLGAWLEVLGFTDEEGTSAWVVGQTGLARHTRRLAAAVKKALPAILETGPQVRARLDQSGFQSESDVGRIRHEARAAFGRGDYEEAAHLFVEIEELLTATEAKQLRFAQGKLVG
jgi:hypothetical protein